MTAPKAILKDQIVGTTLAQLQAVGSNEGLQIGAFGYAEDSGIVYRCASVDGPNASTWTTAAPHRYFDPMAEPLVAHPSSLEFGRGSIAGLTTWNPGSNISLSAWNGFLRVESERQSTTECGGAYVPIPSGNWSVTTCIRHSPAQPLSSTGYTVGLAVFPTVVNNVSRSWVIEMFQPGNLSTNPSLRVYGYLDFTAASVSGSIDLIQRFTMTAQMFFRIRYNPTTPRISFDFSHDGLTWYVAFTTTSSLYLTPAHVGVFVNNALSNTERVNLLCPFLRFTADDTIPQLTGRVV